jgi:integrase
MDGAMKRVEDNSYLEQRGRVWWYNRRVPERFARLDTRRRIKATLGTTSLDQARYKRDLLAEADEHYWASLMIAEEAGPGCERDAGEAVRRRYRMATLKALASGFTYQPIDHLATMAPLAEALARLLAVHQGAGPQEIPKARDAEALLGGAPKPAVTVSEAFQIYVREIAYNAQLYKSPNQQASWEKTKRTSIQYFIDFAGDIPLEDITRELALDYQKHWAGQVKPKDPGAAAIAPNTANRHIGNVRSLYGDYFRHVGEEDRPNPFRNMHFKARARTEVPPFSSAWVRQKILAPGATRKWRPELQLITLMLIETGCRPSEIINLRIEDFHMDEPVPYISIRARTDREVKTDTSERDIPLVGISIEAAKRAAPKAFPHYYDKGELFSANMMKNFRNRGLLETPEHRIYSFRHAFEKRMQEANVDYGLRCLLMGHKTTRPVYGDGGSLAYRRDELLKIVHPFETRVMAHFDQENPEWSWGAQSSG